MPNASPVWLSVIFFIVGLLSLTALIYVDPASFDSMAMKTWAESFTILLYVFIALSAFLVFWILKELPTTSTHYGIPEFIGIVAIVFSTLIIFANLYRANGLILGQELITPPWTDALYFSISVFTSNGIGEFLPPPHMRKYVALETLLGFLTVPVLITMGFTIYQKKTASRG